MDEQDRFETRVEEIVNNEFSDMDYEKIAESLCYLTSVYQSRANRERRE